MSFQVLKCLLGSGIVMLFNASSSGCAAYQQELKPCICSSALIMKLGLYMVSQQWEFRVVALPAMKLRQNHSTDNQNITLVA